MRRTLITKNADFAKCMNTLKDLRLCPEFSKKEFVKASGDHTLRSPNSMFENLRTMKLVVLVRVEDLSYMVDQYGDEQELSIEEYNALPQCVKDALDWKVRPMVRHWYKVDDAAIQHELNQRKMEVIRDYDLLNSL